jgi:hypothetical protein
MIGGMTSNSNLGNQSHRPWLFFLLILAVPKFSLSQIGGIKIFVTNLAASNLAHFSTHSFTQGDRLNHEVLTEILCGVLHPLHERREKNRQLRKWAIEARQQAQQRVENSNGTSTEHVNLEFMT